MAHETAVSFTSFPQIVDEEIFYDIKEDILNDIFRHLEIVHVVLDESLVADEALIVGLKIDVVAHLRALEKSDSSHLGRILVLDHLYGIVIECEYVRDSFQRIRK